MKRSLAVSVLLSLPMAACNKDEIVWVPFNSRTDQTVVVQVAPSELCDSGEPAALTLLSSLGLTDVGEGFVDPRCGPVGTNHQVSVLLDDPYQTIVGRVTVDVATDAVGDLDGDGDPDDRGEGEYVLNQDSADPGAWAITLQSLGAEGEEREDRFTFHLWQPEELAPPEPE